MPVDWHFDLYKRDGTGTSAALSLYTDQGPIAPIGLSFTKNLSATGTITTGVSLRDTRYIKHDWVSPREHDYKLLINDGIHYNNLVLQEGTIISHEVDVETELSLLAGEDYLGLFDRRGYPFDPTFGGGYSLTYPYKVGWGAYGTPATAPVDVGQIVTDLINTVLARPYSQFAPTLNIPVMGFSQDYLLGYNDTSSLNSLIQGFAQGYPGFDYQFVPPITFSCFKTEYDPTHTAVYEFIEGPDGIIPGVTAGPKWTNTGPQGTHGLGLGAGVAAQLAQNYAYDPSMVRYRRLDIFPNFGNLLSLTHLQRATAGALGIALAPVYQLTMTVDPDFISTPNGFWHDFQPGAYVWIKKDLIAHMLNNAFKIVQMNCVVSDEGQCLVTLNMNVETDLSLFFSDQAA